MSALIRIDGPRPRPWLAAMSRLVIGAALGALALSPLSCSSDDGCDGVEVAGRCEQKCNPAACPVAGSTCFDNACASPCPNNDTAAECPLGTRCETLAPDLLQYCVIYDFAKGDSGMIGQSGDACTGDEQCDWKRGWTCGTAGTCVKLCESHAGCNVDAGEYCSGGECLAGGNKKYEPCQASSECAQGAGFQCVDGECRVTGCRSHQDCAVLGHCAPGATDAGESVLACVKGTTHPEGQFGTLCQSGPDECDAAAGYICMSAGPGDIEGYCTKTGCQADSDCGIGQYCSTVRTSRPPCQDACGFTGQPSSATCVPATNIGAGKEYSCGPLTLLRNVCLKREFCNECESDTDCLGLPNQICSADSGGRKICTEICDPVTNSCPWGNAASCGDYDGDGVFTCSHRYPTGCVGEGKSCHPCLDDADCPGGLCLKSDFTQERYCVDLGPSCTCHPCSVDEDCPNGQCEGRCRFAGAVCVSDGQCEVKTCVSGKCDGTVTSCTGDEDCVNTCNKGNYYCKGITVTQGVLCKTSTVLETGCPKTPGGLEMNCYGGNELKSAGSALYNKCVGANVNPNPLATPQGGCWPKP
jgi:hypothetical protein